MLIKIRSAEGVLSLFSFCQDKNQSAYNTKPYTYTRIQHYNTVRLLNANLFINRKNLIKLSTDDVVIVWQEQLLYNWRFLLVLSLRCNYDLQLNKTRLYAY